MGIICSVEIELKEIKSSFLEVETKVAKNILEMENYFEKVSNDYDYAVAWLDCSAKRKFYERYI